eukprot:768896-Pelagomonas_calceolata.AAC.1
MPGTKCVLGQAVKAETEAKEETEAKDTSSQQVIPPPVTNQSQAHLPTAHMHAIHSDCMPAYVRARTHAVEAEQEADNTSMQQGEPPPDANQSKQELGFHIGVFRGSHAGAIIQNA